MGETTLADVNKKVFDALEAPPLTYYGVLAILGAGVGVFLIIWLYQIKTGMGVTGLNNPTGWGVYIANFVFWVGIAHSGTLISAILYLVRAKYRDAVSRSSEAMTIFAIAIAGLFPLIHLGRFWVFYFILPYPSERQIWPNFISALLWDVTAVFTYFTVSLIFFYVGLIPDLAAAREHFRQTKGESHLRTKIYRFLSMGWHGASSQWRHYSRAYLYFAGIATPLVVSVHSVVSWDFAMSLLPGWHTTLFAPYFVAGAIHSGLAMVLVLMIPMRKLLRLESIIKINHFEKVAQTMLVTAAIIGYSYLVLPLITWYSGDIYDIQFEKWRATQTWAWAYWGIIILNVLIASLFGFSKIRRNLKWLFIIGIVVVTGMWIERFFLVSSSQMHDFLPHNWGSYKPTIFEITITAGSFCLFFFLFVSFTKILPVIPLTDFKTRTIIDELEKNRIELVTTKITHFEKKSIVYTGYYKDPVNVLQAIKELIKTGYTSMEVFTPVKMATLLKIMDYTKSPVALWTFLGGITGTVSGFALTIYCALTNSLIVGGKHPVSIIPYVVISFELTILFAAIANLIALIHYTSLRNADIPMGYDPRFVLDTFGIAVCCRHVDENPVKEIFNNTGALETKINLPVEQK